MITGAAIVLVTVNAKLALISALAMPPIAVLTWFFAHRLFPISRLVQAKKGHLTEASDEAVVGIEMVQAFGREEDVRTRFLGRAEAVRHETMRQATIEAHYLPGLLSLPTLGIAAVLFFGGRDVIAGTLTIGEFMLFITLLLQLVWPLEALGWIINLGQRAVASAGRSFAWLEGIEPLPEPVEPQELPAGQLEVRFEDVHFSYGGADVLRGVDLTVEPGQIVALCGPTGAGKTTLLNLLPRFYDPTAGQVLIGGVDTRDTPIEELRRAVAIVTQKPVLFSVLLRDNLLSARPDADWEEVLAACEAAGVSAFVDDLPARLRHADRGARRQPVGRPAPAGRARACAPRGLARPRARRSDVVGRHRDRAPARREPAAGGRGAHGARRDPAAVDDRRRRSRGRARRRPDHRAGQAAGAARSRRPLRRALRRRASCRVSARTAPGFRASRRTRRTRRAGWS